MDILIRLNTRMSCKVATWWLKKRWVTGYWIAAGIFDAGISNIQMSSAAVTSSWLATLSSANQREILFLFYFYKLRHAVSTWIGTEQSGLAQIHASEFNPPQKSSEPVFTGSFKLQAWSWKVQIKIIYIFISRVSGRRTRVYILVWVSIRFIRLSSFYLSKSEVSRIAN